ncbi:hypothetical protein HP456_14805 [Bacillus haikouensis]|uniref:hypothetical protein n=1 Tax=Bacillus haikouensis TaxID=1510468 RepID=UPI00155829DF|nr:hypothetical protein [Bacillus haikouensis]NQD67183.1 hypothetical protein [Bacillus haikouensis]
MHKRLIGAFVLLGILSIPSFASAEGGLLSTVTDEVDSVANEVISVEEKEPAPDEEGDKSSHDSLSHDDGKETRKNVISSAVDTVSDTVGNTTGTVSGTVNSVTREVSDTVNETVETATEPVTDITGGSAAPVTDTVKSTTESVTKTVRNTTKSVTTTVETTTENVTETVEDTTKPVTDPLTDDEPLLEVNVSEKPDVKVDTEVIETEVSEDSTVKLETGTTETDAGKSPSVNAEEEADAIPSADVNEKTGETVSDKSAGPSADAENSMNKARKLEKSITAKESESAPPVTKKVKTDETKDRLPLIPDKKMEPIVTNTTMQPGAGQSTGTSGMNGSTTISNSHWIVWDNDANRVRFLRSDFNGNQNLYYDQWLNAPPSQPPQTSLLYKSI